MKMNDAAVPEQDSRIQDIPPLRIALVAETYPPEVNGVAMTLGHLVETLRERSHMVSVIRPRQAHEEEPHIGCEQKDLLVKGLPIPGYPELRFGLSATTRLKKRWQAERPDIVHIATQGPLGWSARRAARTLGLPVSSSFHTNFDAYSRHYGIGWLRRLIAAALRVFHNGTDATFVPTRRLSQELTLTGYRNVSVVSRGIDTNLFSPLRRSHVLRTRWGIDPNGLIVTYVGRIAAEKNLELVFAAFNEVQRARHDARLVLVGDGPLLVSLQARYPQHVFAGVQRNEALAAHYASADIFLFPSLTETFGNVTVEALASGLGVVCYDYAAATELIVDGHNGLLTPIDDANGFINSAVMLATDRALLARMRLRACASVSRLDWGQTGNIFAAQLRNVITRHQRKQRMKDALVIATD